MFLTPQVSCASFWLGGRLLAGADMARWSDEELLSAIRQESEDAFAQLVINYMPMILNLVARFRKALVDSEDLAQEGLLGLLSAARHYESGSTEFSAFAYVCIRRRMLSAVRKASRQKDRPLSDILWEEELENFPSEKEDGSDPAHLLLRREEEEQLLSQLRETLTDLEYHVLILYLAAYTYEELARKLGVSTKTVDNALQRVRKKMTLKGLNT